MGLNPLYYRGIRPNARQLTARNSQTLCLAVPITPTNEDEWPARNDILAGQQDATNDKPKQATVDTDSLVRFYGMVWISVEADELYIKLLTIVHPGVYGHRGGDGTSAALCE